MAGKLDRAVAAQGAAILFLPIVLGAAGLVGRILTSLEVEGPAFAFLGVPMLLGPGRLVLKRMDRT